MATYKVTIMGITAANIKQAEKKVREAFGDEFAAQVMKQDPARSRADRLSEAEAEVSNAASTVEELRDELQEWHDNLPESLQGGGKGDELNDAIQELETIKDNLEQIDFGSVSFPAMY